MATPVILVDAKTGRALETKDFGAFGTLLIVGDPLRVNGVFKTTKFTVAGGVGSTTIAMPVGYGSIVLSDLVISFEKKATAEVTIQFNDGTNTEPIWFMDMGDAPISFASNFAGRWWGWRGAYLEVVVANVGLDGSVGVGYAKLDKANSLTYDDWNAGR
jgi:hypothetical protein